MKTWHQFCNACADCNTIHYVEPEIIFYATISQKKNIWNADVNEAEFYITLFQSLKQVVRITMFQF